MKKVGRTKVTGTASQQNFLDPALAFEMGATATTVNAANRAVNQERQPRLGSGRCDHPPVRNLALRAVEPVVGGHRERRGGTVKRHPYRIHVLEVRIDHLGPALTSA